MGAICFLEANYNWLNKFVFTKQMMGKAFQGYIIPAEQFAKRGSQATEGVLTSGLFCDIAWALHKTVAIESVDLANCYDAVAHPIASIALQSFKVCKVMGAMMLYVLETMTWYLKTVFGQSKICFGGTALDPSMGLGQGNGALPPGFLAVCTLMMNVYYFLFRSVSNNSKLSVTNITVYVISTQELEHTNKINNPPTITNCGPPPLNRAQWHSKRIITSR
jgi:hypothetical protein